MRLLSHIREANALIVYVVDIFDFNGSIIPGLHRFVGKNPVLLVGNKEDLLPRSLRRSKLTDWLRQQANQAGIRPLMTTLVSAKRITRSKNYWPRLRSTARVATCTWLG